MRLLLESQRVLPPNSLKSQNPPIQAGTGPQNEVQTGDKYVLEIKTLRSVSPAVGLHPE
jgi:hypothetical protein